MCVYTHIFLIFLSSDFLYAFEEKYFLPKRYFVASGKKEQYSVRVYEAVASLGPPSKQTGDEIM